MTEPRDVDVAIVGGGLTGLVAARSFALEGRWSYQVLEAGTRFGGNLRTEEHGDYQIDPGPDGFVRTKPHAEALCRALGLGDELIETLPTNRRVYMVHRRKLVEVPHGMVLAAPTDLTAMARTPLLSWRGKLAILRDLHAPARIDGADESIASFLRRRLGDEMVEAFGQPLLAGIYAGDAEQLSLRSTFPQLADMERDHGSLIRGARATMAARRAKHGDAIPSAFLSLQRGMGTLIDALVESLPVARRTLGAQVERVARRDEGRWLVQGEGFEPLRARRVLLALPAAGVARLVAGHDREVDRILASQPSHSTATVFFAWPRSEVRHRLDASGFIVPRREGMALTAGTFVTSKWAGRAPYDTAIVRGFFGGALDPDRVETNDDDALTGTARRELGALLGVSAAPRWSRVYRWARSNPQPNVGHDARMALLHERFTRAGLHVAGGGHGGIGIPDCTKQGEQAAEALRRTLDTEQGGRVEPKV